MRWRGGSRHGEDPDDRSWRHELVMASGPSAAELGGSGEARCRRRSRSWRRGAVPQTVTAKGPVAVCASWRP